MEEAEEVRNRQEKEEPNTPRKKVEQLGVILFDSLVKLILFAVELFSNSLTRKAVDGAVASDLMIVGLELDGAERSRLLRWELWL